MNPDELADRMRQGEVFHSLRMLPGAWVVLRVDGRGFSRLTEERYEKPFDARFHEVMVRTASTRGRYPKEGVDPRDGRTVLTERRRLAAHRGGVRAATARRAVRLRARTRSRA